MSPQEIQNFFANTPLGHAIGVFLGTFLVVMTADWSDTGAIDMANWQQWVIPAASSAVAVLASWLNPQDQRFGKKAVASKS